MVAGQFRNVNSLNQVPVGEIIQETKNFSEFGEFFSKGSTEIIILALLLFRKKSSGA